MLGRSLGNLEGQDFGFNRDGRVLVTVGRPSATITGERLTALYRDLQGRLARIPGVQGAGLALYNPLTNNWGEGHPDRRQASAGAGRADQRVVGPRHARLPAAARHDAGQGPPLHRGRQRDRRGGGDRERGVREAVLQARGGSARPALRAQPARERQPLPHRRRHRRCAVPELPDRSAGAADVLRAAAAAREVREPDDGARADRVDVRGRAAARHQRTPPACSSRRWPGRSPRPIPTWR